MKDRRDEMKAKKILIQRGKKIERGWGLDKPYIDCSETGRKSRLEGKDS